MLSLLAYLGEVIPVAVFLYNLPVQGFPGMPELLLPVMLCFPYMFLHRRRPLIAFLVVGATAYVQLAAGIGLLVADVMLLLALYRVARADSWRRSVPTTAAVVIWALLIALPARTENGWSIGDVALVALLPVLAWLLGSLSQTRHRYVLSLEERARQAEREQEIRARVAVIEERTRIARELHDIVSHGLSAIVLLADGAASVVRKDPEVAARTMRTVSSTGRTAMAEMRSMLLVLRADGVDEGTPAPGLKDLDALIDQSRTVGVPVTMQVTGTPVPIGGGAELAVYRMIQEALTNVRKHAEAATAVQVAVQWGSDELAIEITDDGERDLRGNGEDVAVEGLGLTGMRERVTAQGGMVEFSRPLSGGFRIRAGLPIAGGELG
ncbi:sensor histidine kinase [Tsukamurella serpentis]